jgi:nicotinamide-nucleotide amidase
MKRKKYGVYFTTRSSLQMKYLVEHEIIPKVVREYASPIHRTILTYGQGESVVAERIEDWENNLPGVSNYLPAPGRVRLRLSARGTDKEN